MEPFPSEMSEGMQHISESVFVGLCDILGTPQKVAIRRDTEDIMEMVNKEVTPDFLTMQILSGSLREGFRGMGSDLDLMFYAAKQRVIMDISQSEYYNTAKTTLILSDSSESPPGFTLLQLLTPTADKDVQSSCIRKNGKLYIASSTFRQLTCSIGLPNSTVHGPCGSGCVAGVQEYDHAFCFASDFWPSFASSWMKRCHVWPGQEVVNDIVKNGCHFVAIGHPSGPQENEEWRISFSQAEYKCVYAMNHTQFLTYGLLKLFLKEVINQHSEETNTLMCSYHMKTAVLWAIQQNTLPHWCPQNLLIGFWVCFKLLLKWVYEGICPNFFIPQNNLFLTKIHGSAQNRLFLQLHELYEKGLACLLQCSSIRSYILDVLYYPRISFFTDDCITVSDVDYDLELFKEFDVSLILEQDFHSCLKYLLTVEQLIGSHLTRYQVPMIQRITTFTFLNIAFILHKECFNTCGNKQMYIADKRSRHMLGLTAKFGCISDMLYIAMYYNKTFRYVKALSAIQMTKVKLSRQYMIYNGRVDRERYTEAVGGLSWSTKMREAMAEDIVLYNEICYINELIPEQNAALQIKCPVSQIPVFVMLHFLEFLCYRHIDTTLSQAALDELHDLLHHDQGLYVFHGDISWEILGICQQIAGNLQDALYSYKQSLTQYPWNKIKDATHRRTRDSILSMLWS